MKAPQVASKGPLYLGGALLATVLLIFIVLPEVFAGRYDSAQAQGTSTVKAIFNKVADAPPTLDTKDYDRRMLKLANYASTTASTTRAWPVKGPYPKVGAVLPFKRIVAYYGNFYSTKMGALGEYPPDIMVQKLDHEVKVWAAADPSTPVVPAIHYIVTTAQGTAQADGTYRLRMPAAQIQKAIDLGNQIHGLVFLDIQVGLSDLPRELPRLEPYLKQPNVHLAVDPEFAMHNGVKPGRVIGTMDAVDINYATTFLARIVKENNLPPKILVIHRFTEDMVTGYKRITLQPEVQIVMDMDGWGFGAKKINTYKRVITQEPVQFTGFKLFYKNDLKPPSTRLLTPQEVLSLTPAPSYIQYQ
ncbi:MAG: hypothetical protein AAB472_01770 [Patescibacteria group bacterium]